ncbi:TPA: alanine racemase [Klebsiella pneumoniae]|uniref:alanine racemase n=1 Tax=Klebsiella pneumoniae complex TaxID=3390273 RepID=UPI0007660036|nr:MULTISPECIES: alanine racemase [Klebsiella]MCI8176642.1 alanine racemase [Klebsiella pneumoniae]NWO50134.1 alanine racemase [Klebsiella pneumoniae]VGQ14633.1 Alanine racemase, catabolic [Klebsiella variicola]HBW7834834.1 alanine racemase [Klebsiella pneumoniae]HBX6200008.1 alanine racemase [Klebsiella pneumoniae]
MPRPIKAEINIAALNNNLKIISDMAVNANIWAVIKANAYGHGIENVLSTLEHANGLALLDFDEAVKARELGWKKPILLLEGFFHASDLELIEKYQLTTAVHSEWQLRAIEAFQPAAPVDIYLKINTGMNRLGFPAEQAMLICQNAQNSRYIGNITLMSHFACADEAGGVKVPEDIIRHIARESDLTMCIANSAATIWHPATHNNWVRPGIILYGASPSGIYKDIAMLGIKPVMSLKSEVIAIQQLSQGSTVGYGGRYKASGEERIGIIACGYADGYPRQASSGTPVSVNGRLTETRGAVSMDMIAIDLTSCPEAEVGTEVELWGENLPVDTVANHAGTIGYELLSAVTPRVTRVIIR